MLRIIVREIKGLLRPYGFLVNSSSVGGSVARANEAKESIIRLTQSSCVPVKGLTCKMTCKSYLTDTNYHLQN